MRGLLALVVGMGVLIVAGVVGLAVVVAGRLAGGAGGTRMVEMGLGEPEGSGVVSAGGTGDRMALVVRGGGEADRVVVVDLARGGRVVARVRVGK